METNSRRNKQLAMVIVPVVFALIVSTSLPVAGTGFSFTIDDNFIIIPPPPMENGGPSALGNMVLEEVISLTFPVKAPFTFFKESAPDFRTWGRWAWLWGVASDSGYQVIAQWVGYSWTNGGRDVIEFQVKAPTWGKTMGRVDPYIGQSLTIELSKEGLVTFKADGVVCGTYICPDFADYTWYRYTGYYADPNTTNETLTRTLSWN